MKKSWATEMVVRQVIGTSGASGKGGSCTLYQVFSKPIAGVCELGLVLVPVSACGKQSMCHQAIIIAILFLIECALVANHVRKVLLLIPRVSPHSRFRIQNNRHTTRLSSLLDSHCFNLCESLARGTDCSLQYIQ